METFAFPFTSYMRENVTNSILKITEIRKKLYVTKIPEKYKIVDTTNPSLAVTLD
jgi:hypothetical protein